MLLFVIAPLAGMFIHSPVEDLVATTQDEEFINSVILTLGASVLGTLVLAIFAIPLAFIIARKDFFGKKVILGIINLPVVIPHSAAGIAVLGFISRDSVIGSFADNLGLSLVGHPISISIAMAFVSIPFLLNSAIDGFEAVPKRLEKAALNLGASPLRVFLTVSFPLAWRSVLTGLTMMFARGISEFGAVVIVAYHPMITPVLIWERFGNFGLSYARPAAAIFILICLVVFIGLRILSSKKRSA